MTVTSIIFALAMVFLFAFAMEEDKKDNPAYNSKIGKWEWEEREGAEKKAKELEKHPGKTMSAIERSNMEMKKRGL